MVDDLRTLYRFDRNRVVQAGAGTGKTYNLVKVYVHLLAGLTHNALSGLTRWGFEPEDLVAVTFTDKAAAEMRDRIQEKITELEEDPTRDADLNAAAEDLGRSLPDREAWTRLREAMSHATIGTFHGLCGRILREHAVAAGLDPRFGLLTGDGEDRELWEEVVKEVVLAETREGGAAWRALTRFKLAAEGPFGAGLLDVLWSLRAQLLREGRPLSQLLDGPGGETWEEQAIEERLHQAGRFCLVALRGLVEQAEVATAKAKEKLATLRTYVDHHAEALLALHTADTRAVLEGLGEVYTLLRYSLSKTSDPQRQDVRRAIEGLGQLIAQREAAPIARDLRDLLVAADRAYTDAKIERGVLDFEDLLIRARDLLRDHPDVRARLKAQIRVLLVDEFQDTNQLQKDLVYLLSEAPGHEAPCPAGEPVAHHVHLAPAKLFVVGDRKQSIYRFRGAEVEVFEETLEELSSGRLAGEAPTTPSSLRLCRRSLPGVISAVNLWFGGIMGQADPPQWDPTLDVLSPLRPDPAAGPCLELISLAPPEGAEAPPRARAVELEARAIAARIGQLVEEGHPAIQEAGPDGERPRPPRWGDVVLLLRKFTHLEIFQRELILRRIPHVVVKGRGFFGAQEVRDLLCLLRLMVERHAQVPLLAVLRSPLVGLPDDALAALALSSREKALRLADLVARFGPHVAQPEAPPGLDAADAARLTRFLALYQRLAPQAEALGAAGLLRAVLDATAFDAVMAGGFQGPQKIANLEKLLYLARRWEEKPGASLAGFVRRMARQLEEEPRESLATVEGAGEDVVRIMTVHQSKGLEFPVVIVPGLGDPVKSRAGYVLYDRQRGLGLSLPDPQPGAKSAPVGAFAELKEILKQKEIEEARRLMYVAVTRARDRVILVGEAAGKNADNARAWLEAHRQPLRDAGLLDIVDGAALLGRPRPDFGRRGGPRDLAELEAATAHLTPAALEEARHLLAQTRPPDPAQVTVRRLVAPVTQLDDFHLCARRYLLWHELNLEEFPNVRGNRPEAPAAEASPETLGEADGALDPLRRGTLAHALLEEVDLSRFEATGPAAVDALLEDQGYTLDDPQVAGVRDDVLSLLQGPFGQGLRALPASAVHREWPFTLRVRGVLFLTGKMDLLLRLGEGRVRVVDYKHTRREGRTAADYAFQLLAYSLAARRLLGATEVEAEIVFLRDRDHPWQGGPMVLTPTGAEIDTFEDHLAELGDRLIRARLEEHFPLSPLEHCREIRCGYVRRCHGVRV